MKRHRIIWTLAVASCLSLLETDAAESFVPASVVGQLGDPELHEASGMAASIRNPPLLWSHNDSGNRPRLFLLGPDGSARATVEVNGAKNRDWEDMDSFTLDGKLYLLIADTGDNGARRESCSISVLPEPDPVRGRQQSVSPTWTIRFRYLGGPRDCEAVASDPRARSILLISKRTRPPVAYELPLQPHSQKIHTAREIGAVRLPCADFWEGPFANQPTGLAISPDGRMAAVLTYARVFLFRKDPSETWAEAFARPPERLARHGLLQAEAISFSRDGREILVVSEGGGILSYRKAGDPANRP